MPTFYQGDLFRSMTATGEVDLEVIFAKPLTSDRLGLGWQNDLSGYIYRFLDKRHPVLSAVRMALRGRNRLHIVNGLWAESAFAAALLTLASTGSRYAVYSEAPDPRAVRSAPKRVLQAVLGGLLVRRLAGVLSISHLAADFYRKLGARQAVIYPFGYFRSKAQITGLPQGGAGGGKAELIFVGQLIDRKGVDLLLQAATPLFAEYPDLCLSVVGVGELLGPLQRQIETLEWADRVRLEGALPPAQIPARLAEAAALVLPSRWDGWGMVVNEAFSVGLPAIVSDACGVADLVRHGENGYIFRSEDVADLQGCLRDFLNKRAAWGHFRTEAQRTGDKISVEAVTPYLLNVIACMAGKRPGKQASKPAPPWAEPVALAGIVDDIVEPVGRSPGRF